MINYLATGIRLDISYTVSRLYKANTGLSEAYLIVLKYLYKYLEITKVIGILLGGKYLIDSIDLKAYGDTSYADDLRIRYLTSTYVVFLLRGPVFWKTKK